MKYSNQFSDAIHILAYIAIFHDQSSLSSDVLASSVETNPARVRKIMASLKKAGLIQTTKGHPTPELTKQPQQISFLDIWGAISYGEPLLQVDTNTNPECIVGSNIQSVLSQKYDYLQKTVEQEMTTITLDQVVKEIATEELKKHPQNKKILLPYLN